MAAGHACCGCRCRFHHRCLGNDGGRRSARGAWSCPKTLAHNVECFAAIVGLREDALRLHIERLIEEIFAAPRNHAVGELVPSCNRQPSIAWRLEKVSTLCCLALDKVTLKKDFHVLGIDRPIAGDHVHKTRTSICWLEQCCKVASFHSNLRKQLDLSIPVSTPVDN